MTHGGDHISINQLIKIYKLKINPKSNMVIFNDKLRYKDILQEALYIWYMLRVIKMDSLIGKYINHSKLNIIRQETIEMNIMPTNSNFKFDLGFPNLNILVEVNEYKHEQPEKIIQDAIKNSLAILCGYTATTLKVKDVFDMDESSYNKLSDTEIHDKLAESDHLKTFSKTFVEQITAALLEFKDVRDDYIMVLFKQMLKTRIQEIVVRINFNINNKNILEALCQTNEYNGVDITNYKNHLSFIESDKLMLDSTKFILNSLNTNEDFIELFNIKHRCSISQIPNIITFQEIVKLLKVKSSNVDKFRIILLKLVYRINDMYTAKDDIFITWVELSEVISNYESKSTLKIMLEMYYREVSRSYELVIQIIKSHTDSLKTNRDTLTTYVNHANAQNLNIIETLKEKNKILLDDKNQAVKDTDKIICKLQKNLYDATKHGLREFDIVYDDDIEIPIYNIIDNVESTFMNNLISNYDKLLIDNELDPGSSSDSDSE